MLVNRIQLVIDIKTGGNVAQFSRVTGLSQGFIHRIKDKAQRKTLMAILYAYPDIDKDWLISGLGKPPVIEKEKNVNELLEVLDKKVTNLSKAVHKQLEMAY